MYLYVHGFLSSSLSLKAQQLKTWLTEQGRADEWCCPDLPVNPHAAIKQLSDIIENAQQPVKLVGSSLGGFYATILCERYDLKTVVINPSVHSGLSLRSRIGTHKAWHSEQNVAFTIEDANALNELDCYTVTRPDNLLVMLERGDETLDYRRAQAFYRDCHQVIFNGGNHGFSRFERMLPLIEAFFAPDFPLS